MLYACQTVAAPMFTTSCMLAVGFGIVAMSSFLVNTNLGLLTMLAVVFALLCDLFLLPSLLLFISRKPGAGTVLTSAGKQAVSLLILDVILAYVPTVAASEGKNRGRAIAVEADRRDEGFSGSTSLTSLHGTTMPPAS